MKMEKCKKRKRLWVVFRSLCLVQEIIELQFSENFSPQQTTIREQNK